MLTLVLAYEQHPVTYGFRKIASMLYICAPSFFKTQVSHRKTPGTRLLIRYSNTPQYPHGIRHLHFPIKNDNRPVIILLLAELRAAGKSNSLKDVVKNRAPGHLHYHQWPHCPSSLSHRGFSPEKERG